MDNLRFPAVSVMPVMRRVLHRLGIRRKPLVRAYLLMAGTQLEYLLEGRALLAVEDLKIAIADAFADMPGWATLERMRYQEGSSLRAYQIVLLLVGAGLAHEGVVS